MSIDNLFNVNQAAFILKVHPLTVRRYIKEGRLKALKVGGNVRIKESDLNNFNKDYDPSVAARRIVFKEKQVVKTFSVNDPLLQLQGRGARVKLSS